jgi:hypothetical protein
MKKKFRGNGKSLIITPRGEKNRGRVGQICGNLAEEHAEKILSELLSGQAITSFRRATDYEDQRKRTDFVITLISGRVVGLQIKSSNSGISDFKTSELSRPIERPYPVMPCVIKLVGDIKKEGKSLLKELYHFETAIKKELSAVK